VTNKIIILVWLVGCSLLQKTINMTLIMTSHDAFDIKSSQINKKQ